MRVRVSPGWKLGFVAPKSYIKLSTWVKLFLEHSIRIRWRNTKREFFPFFLTFTRVYFRVRNVQFFPQSTRRGFPYTAISGWLHSHVRGNPRGREWMPNEWGVALWWKVNHGLPCWRWQGAEGPRQDPRISWLHGRPRTPCPVPRTSRLHVTVGFFSVAIWWCLHCLHCAPLVQDRWKTITSIQHPQICFYRSPLRGFIVNCQNVPLELSLSVHFAMAIHRVSGFAAIFISFRSRKICRANFLLLLNARFSSPWLLYYRDGLYSLLQFPFLVLTHVSTPHHFSLFTIRFQLLLQFLLYGKR